MTSDPTKPTCPACRSDHTHQESNQRHQCDRCGWRFIVDAQGRSRDWLDLSTAGRSRKRPAFRPARFRK